MPDLRFESFAQAFVGVEGQDPIVRRKFRGNILLRRVSVPRRLDHTGPELGRNFYGSVVRSTIENQDFIAAAKALNDTGNVAFFVKRDDRCRDFHSSALVTRLGLGWEKTTEQIRKAQRAQSAAARFRA